MKFVYTEVIKTLSNTFYIQWDVIRANIMDTDVTGDYNFVVYRSFDPITGFEEIIDDNGIPAVIDGGAGPFVYEHKYEQLDFNIDIFYKVVGVSKSDPTTFFTSEIVFVNDGLDGVQRVIKHGEEVLHNFYTGEKCHVLKRKVSGEVCPRCWSKERQQRVYSQCDECNGTGYIVGYYNPIVVQISIGATYKQSDNKPTMSDGRTQQEGRMSNYPIVKNGDLIVAVDTDRRFVVVRASTTKIPMLSTSKVSLSKQNYVLSQILSLQEMDPTDNEYRV